MVSAGIWHGIHTGGVALYTLCDNDYNDYVMSLGTRDWGGGGWQNEWNKMCALFKAHNLFHCASQSVQTRFSNREPAKVHSVYDGYIDRSEEKHGIFSDQLTDHTIAGRQTDVR